MADSPSGYSGFVDSAASGLNGLYNSPYFDLVNFYMPKTFKELARWAMYYYENDGTVSAAITKLATYPVTDVIPVKTNGGSELTQNYLKMFKKLKIQKVLKKKNIERFSIGNSFITINPKFSRKLACPHCGKEYEFKKTPFKYSNGEFMGTCSNTEEKCNGSEIKFKLVDTFLKTEPDIVFINILNLKLDHNPITGESIYYYSLPQEITKKMESTDDKDFLYSIPEAYFKAKKNNEQIKFSKKNLFHSKNESLSSYKYAGYGMPPLQPILKTLFFRQVLRKSNSVIASDRILGKRYISPVTTSGQGVGQGNISPALFRSKVEEEMKKYQTDPNYIAIFPENINFGNMGGDGKMYFTLQEEKILEDEIITGLMVPPEFVRGGLSFSGSSVSLRMLENQMLNTRDEDIEFVNEFLVPQLATIFDMDEEEFKLKDFKMADDIQKRQLDFQETQAGLRSKTTYLKDQGGNFKSEMRQRKEDALTERSAVIADAFNTASAARIQAIEQAKAQIEATKLTTELTLQNSDGSYTPKNLKATTDAMRTWKAQGYNTGGLMKAVDATMEQSRKQMEMQMQMQQQQMAMQQPQQGQPMQGQPPQGQPQDQGTPEEQEQAMMEQVYEFVNQELQSGKSYMEISSELTQQGVPDEVIKQIMSQVSPKGNSHADLLDDSILVRIFASMMQLPDEDLDKAVYGATIGLSALEKTEYYNKLEPFIVIYNALQEGYDVNTIGSMMNEAKYDMNYCAKIINFITSQDVSSKINLSAYIKTPEKKTKFDMSTGTDMRPMPEKNPPRRGPENQTI